MNDTYEQEIDLKDLLFFVLYKWRLVIVAAIVIAVLLGGYKFIRNLSNFRNQDYIKELEEQYEKDIESYEQSKAGFEWDIENLTANIDYELTYQENSVLFQVDPNNKQIASADIFVAMYPLLQNSDSNTLLADPADTVVKAYNSVVTSGKFLIPFSEENNIDISYLKELVQSELDYEGNMLTVTVTHKDENTAKELLDLTLKSLKSVEPEVQRQLGQHSIVVMNENASKVVDPELARSQKERMNNLTLMRKSLIEAEKSLAGITEPVFPDSISSKGILKSGIKYGILGGFLGVILSGFLICVFFLMNGMVYSADELKNRFGLKVLGVFSKVNKKRTFSAIDEWLGRLEGKETVTDNEVYERIAANIGNFIQKNTKILLTGTIEDSVLRELQSKLQEKLPDISFTVGLDINKDTVTLKRLPEYDSIIVVEARGKSKYSRITKEIEALYDMKKSIMGCIVL